MTSRSSNKLTDAQRRCLRFICENGYQVNIATKPMLCGGEALKFMPETLLRLVGRGMLVFMDPTRLEITLAGIQQANMEDAARFR